MKLGSLFSGYGGLDLAVQEVLPQTQTVWHVENDKHPAAILAHHYPDIPNHGDITAVDWGQVEPVDVLTGGFPCQDVSHAGARAGLAPGTRSGLWSHMAHAISQLRPQMVVIENVRGLLSAKAHSDMERDCWCVGDPRNPHMRALGAVLADLADMGYDTRWGTVRASDAGAPHRRERVFVTGRRPQGHEPRTIEYTYGRQQHARDRQAAPGGSRALRPGGPDRGPVRFLPTLNARDHKGRNQRDDATCLPGAVDLLPTPAVNDMGAGKDPQAWDAWTQRMKAAHSNGNGHGKSLSIEALRLLPTATAQDAASSSGRNPAWGHGVTLTDAALDFGPYTAAVARWESVLGRPAPTPATLKPSGKRGLNPVFVEWMMGLPAGWVTDTGIPRAAQLKALGNGVVPQQAALALRLLFGGDDA